MTQALDALIAARARAPFAWGAFDCVLFAADAVLVQSGRDLAAAYRGTYSTAAGAAALLRRLGGLRTLAAQAGPEIPPALARRGDVGLLRHAGRELLGVCAGELWLSPAQGTGLAAQPLTAALAAWRVTHA